MSHRQTIIVLLTFLLAVNLAGEESHRTSVAGSPSRSTLDRGLKLSRYEPGNGISNYTMEITGDPGDEPPAVVLHLPALGGQYAEIVWYGHVVNSCRPFLEAIFSLPSSAIAGATLEIHRKGVPHEINLVEYPFDPLIDRQSQEFKEMRLSIARGERLLTALSSGTDSTSLNLYNSDVQDAELVLLKQFTDLEYLILGGYLSALTDEGLIHLADLPSLRGLVLVGPMFGDHSLLHVGKLDRLEEFEVAVTEVTDAGLGNLAELTNLKTLGLVYTSITGEGLAHLTGLKNLRGLSLRGTDLTDEEARNILGFRSLEHVDLAETGVTDVVLDYLADLPNLKILVIGGTKVTEEKVLEFIEENPRIYVDADEP
jgi:hypothetical protein